MDGGFCVSLTPQAYYESNELLRINCYFRQMAKSVISVRLSDVRLAQLDATCTQLGLNRSEVIDGALRLLPAIISETAELRYDPQWLKRPKTNGG